MCTLCVQQALLIKNTQKVSLLTVHLPSLFHVCSENLLLLEPLK
jgi:hypothetical protein